MYICLCTSVNVIYFHSFKHTSHGWSLYYVYTVQCDCVFVPMRVCEHSYVYMCEYAGVCMCAHVVMCANAIECACYGFYIIHISPATLSAKQCSALCVYKSSYFLVLVNSCIKNFKTFRRLLNSVNFLQIAITLKYNKLIIMVFFKVSAYVRH